MKKLGGCSVKPISAAKFDWSAGIFAKTVTQSELAANVECAPDGGQFAGWELTGAAGLSEDESHGQAPHP